MVKLIIPVHFHNISARLHNERRNEDLFHQLVPFNLGTKRHSQG